MAQLLLASTSRYRRELLERLRLPFTVVAPDADETERAGEPPAELAARLAAAKAESVAAPADAVVIGSDQVASLEGRRLRKPRTPAVALDQLRRAQGRTVLFHTGVIVLDRAHDRRWSHVDVTQVQFARLPDAALERYLALEEPYDCAGSFKSEGLGVALFEQIVTEDPTALIGLPLIWLARVLAAAGHDPLALTPRAPSAR